MLSFQSRSKDVQRNRAQPATEMERSGIEVRMANNTQDSINYYF